MRGNLVKLATRLEQPVQYELVLGEQREALNPLLGQTITLTHTGQIFCDACGRRTNKSFAQGHCYPCMTSLARCDMCVLKPETCHFAAGTCREPEWGERHCNTTTIVYLANTSALKVGITRANQIPTRWMDQGATQALPVYAAHTRHVAGLVEVALAQTMADKTNWRAILKGDGDPMDLLAARDAARTTLAATLPALRASHGEDSVQELDESVTTITYPVSRYPEKIKSHNFDKKAVVSGRLEGIKGQYLIFDTGVINMRKFTGYEVELAVAGV